MILNETVWEFMRLYGTVRDCMGAKGLYGTVRVCMGQAFPFSLNSTSCTRFKGLKIIFLFSWSRTRDMIMSTTAIVTLAVGRKASATSESRVL